MDLSYNLFKFLHIVAVSIWIGGLVAISMLNARFSRKGETARAVMAYQSRRFGVRVLGPAAGLTLITGIVTMAISGMGFSAWIIWGLVAVTVSVVLGATVLRRSNEALNEPLPTAERGALRIAPQQRRRSLLNTIVVLLLLSAVWAMVFKPTLSAPRASSSQIEGRL